MSSDPSARAPADLPPFILSQGMRLLIDTANPRKHLLPEAFRAGRGANDPRGEGDPHDDAQAWRASDRFDVVADCLPRADGSPGPLHRLVLVTDAGIGKTTNLHWLAHQLNHPRTGLLAFCFPLSKLKDHKTTKKLLREVLLLLFKRPRHNKALKASDARRLLKRLLAAGRIALLLDALDHVSADSPAIETFQHLLQAETWRRCPMVVAARPHALDRHWKWFDKREPGWRFVKLEEFNEDEQRAFLGRAPGDARDRCDYLPYEARPILSVPRTLELIRSLPLRELGDLRTPSDVYWKAVCNLIVKGLADHRARMLGAPLGSSEPASDERAKKIALELLAAMAFTMVDTKVANPGDVERAASGEWWWETVRIPAGTLVPNFDRIEGVQDYKEFCLRVFARVDGPRYRGGLRLLRDGSRSLGSHELILEQWHFGRG